MILQLLCVAVLLFLLIVAYFRFCREGRLMAKIPGPPRVPFFGHLAAMYKTPEELFAHLRIWHESYGRLWKLDGLNIRSIHIYHPEDVALILSTTNYNAKDVPYNLLHSWLKEGLLVSTGDKWHQRRKMLTPVFHFKSLNKFFSIFCDHTQNLLATIEKEVDKERTDIIPLISKAALLVMCETMSGTKFSNTSSIDNYLQSIHKLGERLVIRLTKPWYLIKKNGHVPYKKNPDPTEK